MAAVVIVIIVLVIIFLALTVKVVPQAHTYIVERFGKYHASLHAGLNIILPGIDRVVRRISLKEQVADFPPQAVITKDNVTMRIDTVVYYSVVDPKMYTYGVESPVMAIENITATTLRNIIGEMELDETLTSRDNINSKMQSAIDIATDPWGIKVNRVELKNIMPPAEIEEVMTKQMRAERERRQTVLEAQAHQEAVVSRAEGDKRAKILAAEAERDSQIALAEGRAKSIRMVYEAEAEGLKKLNSVQVSDAVLRLKGIEALKDVSDGRATKIYMPSDLTNIIASLGVAGEALGIGDATPIDTSPKPEPELETDPCIDEETGFGGFDAYLTTAEINREFED